MDRELRDYNAEPIIEKLMPLVRLSERHNRRLFFIVDDIVAHMLCFPKAVGHFLFVDCYVVSTLAKDPTYGELVGLANRSSKYRNKYGRITRNNRAGLYKNLLKEQMKSIKKGPFFDVVGKVSLVHRKTAYEVDQTVVTVQSAMSHYYNQAWGSDQAIEIIRRNFKNYSFVETGNYEEIRSPEGFVDYYLSGENN